MRGTKRKFQQTMHLFIADNVGNTGKDSEIPRIFQMISRAYNTGNKRKKTGKGLPVGFR